MKILINSSVLNHTSRVIPLVNRTKMQRSCITTKLDAVYKFSLKKKQLTIHLLFWVKDICL